MERQGLLERGRGVSVKIKIVNTPAVRVTVHIDRPEWREFLYY